MAIVPEQPPHLLRKFGFLQCNQAVYCYCTPLCQQVADETDVLVLGKNHPAVKAVEKRKKLDAELAKALAAGQDPAMLRQQEKAKKAAQQRANQMGLLENVYAKPKPKSYVSYNGASSASAPTLTGATAPAVVKPKISKPKVLKAPKPPPVTHGIIKASSRGRGRAQVYHIWYACTRSGAHFISWKGRKRGESLYKAQLHLLLATPPLTQLLEVSLLTLPQIASRRPLYLA